MTADKPVIKSVGRVAIPKTSMIEAPSNTLPDASDQTSAEYTSPHGSQPQNNPTIYAWMTELMGMKRLATG